jgi:hypothetical protein
MIAGVVGVIAATTARAAPNRVEVATDAASRVDALLASAGGREAWAVAKGYQVWARHYLANELAPFPNTILFDFDAPRVRIESSQQNLWRARILDGEEGWRVTRDSVRRLTSDEVGDDRNFWSANVYRTMHRLASRDKDLGTQLIEGDRLLVLEQGKSLVWFRQNRLGEPVAFGPGALADGTIFGPLVAFGPLSFPSFSVRDGGRWRAIIERFEVNPDLSPRAIRAGVAGS